MHFSSVRGVRPFSSLPIAISSVLSSSVGTSCVREQQRSGQRETRIALRPLTAHNLGKIARCYNGPPSLAFGSPPSLSPSPLHCHCHCRPRPPPPPPSQKQRQAPSLNRKESGTDSSAVVFICQCLLPPPPPPPPPLLLCSSSLSLLSRQILLAESACVAWNGAHSLPTCVVYLCTGLNQLPAAMLGQNTAPMHFWFGGGGSTSCCPKYTTQAKSYYIAFVSAVFGGYFYFLPISRSLLPTLPPPIFPSPLLPLEDLL